MTGMCYEVLQKALTALKGKMAPSGSLFQAVHTFVLNPKSITMGQLYGEFDLMTHEWTDGILSSLIRVGSAATDDDKKWYVFDGPVDAVWIENMNTVLDDNKKLCLSSGEIIKLSESQTMMFEVADLAVASPATVSRCGMVYLEPSILGLKPFVSCWLQTIPEAMQPHADALLLLFDRLLEPSLEFVRKSVREIVGTVNSNLTFSLMKLMDCFFKPFMPQEGKRPTSTEKQAKIPALVEPWFLFALVWSVGATCDNNGRSKFSTWLREMTASMAVQLPFPEEGLVYDYMLDDGGVSLETEDEEELGPITWKNWMAETPTYTITADMNFSDIIVPTMDTVRTSQLLEMLVTANKTVLCVGPTGTGKTLTIADKLVRGMPRECVSDFITFSARTSANQTQDLIDSRLDKRYSLSAREFRKLVDVNFVCAMGPPGGGRNPVTQRLTRHFNFLSLTELEQESKHRIFAMIVSSWMDNSPQIGEHCTALVDACISVYSTITTQLLPTPAKSHYTFNLRDLSKVIQGVLMADASRIEMVAVMEEYMEDYNQVNTAQMKLVLFMDAVKHVTRISRVIRQPLGNALLLGVGGSGRQSLTRLAAHICHWSYFYWLHECTYTRSVNVYANSDIKNESFLEDINNILNSGDVPNIYALDELDQIYAAMKPAAQDLSLQPTKTNLFSLYTKRVRSNLHTVITMSPIGEVFRARLRQFPALVNCCTIDWFSEWPDEALRSVAINFLNEIPDLDADDVVMEGLVCMCKTIHQLVSEKSVRFLQELSRHNYVTPTSYLELLGIFTHLVKLKKSELNTARLRTKTGLDKLLSTAEEVAKMQIELEVMGPELVEATKQTELTMVQIEEDTKIAEVTKQAVEKDEAVAEAQRVASQDIADDAERDLAEALPALDAALKSLDALNKNDIVEVRAMQRPPDGVRLVMEAVCIMFEVKPKKVPGEKLGQKIDDYWDAGKALLQDPPKFISELRTYDKDNIPDAVITKVQPYVDMETFTPAAIAKVSKACTSICLWALAMHKYHFVAKGVAPKRAALAKASEELEITNAKLAEARGRLAEVEDKLAKLQAGYDASVHKKKQLEDNCKLCEDRLVRADKLIGGLADEKDRWADTVKELDFLITNIVGDILVSAGSIAYLGPFTGEYRAQLVSEWVVKLADMRVPHTSAPTLIDTLGDPVRVRAWQIAGLPRDSLSVENAVVMQYSQRWPLFIDPQGQANKWIKCLEKDAGIDVIKLSDKDFLRSLENAIRFGKPCMLENVGEDLDPALEPVLLRQTFKQAGSTVIKLGDAVIPYHDDFKFYITTKLPNPHYTPEVSTKVTIINFTLAPSGLEDQLLALVVAEERPDLEEAKNQLIVSNAQMKHELKEIEDKILAKLSASEGSPVDDVDLIATLGASKVKSQEISAKVAAAEKTELEIDTTRSQYIPVAVRAQILFFCMSDLSLIDPMYQYSLEWFNGIFLGAIANAERADVVEQRIANIDARFTFSLYSNVCRSLFEKHKLLFAFLLCTRIMMNDNRIDMDEWRYLLAGGTHAPNPRPNPASEWLSDRAWDEFLTLAALPNFTDFVDDFENCAVGLRAIFDSVEPHREALPGEWEARMQPFQKILILRCLRADKVTNAFQDFVAANLGQKFIEPQAVDLSEVFKDSSPTCPLIFVLSPGTDPAADLNKFAEEMKFSKKLNSISLGQGQGPRAEAMLRSALERGKWVFFQNCHLAPSWMPSLERLIEQIDPEKVHRDFRAWMTSMPSPKFPVSILQNGSKMTVEPPRGIKANLLKCYANFSDEYFDSCEGKAPVFKHLLLSLCLFYGCVLERRKFGALGFNIPYEFTDGDLQICISQLKMFLIEYAETPFKVLKYTAGQINYGGRVTDDWDRRCLMSVLDGFYCSDVLNAEHKYSESGVYRQIDPDACGHEAYTAYIRGLPINDTPEIFGLHENANITFAQNETFALLNGLLLLQPKSSSGGGQSREEVMEETAKSILERVPPPVDEAMVMEKHPVMYTESMNTVLIQEVGRFNQLLRVIHQSLQDLLKALKGLVVMSQALEEMANSLFINSVPAMWAAKAYPSLKPLASWVTDLVARMHFMQDWIDNGTPNIFWISGFFFPQAFLTGTLQNFARRNMVAIDTISFGFEVLQQPLHLIESAPVNGCYVHGLFIEGAKWDSDRGMLAEARPKELYTDMPLLWFYPEVNRTQPSTGFYLCPLYKTLQRAGTLSTTGHSTNYVLAIEIPSDKPQQHWIKRGVAMLCALKY
ncbi:PREDICTED: dynein heavy chain 1, axonemal-like [Priapulus caudatus]|uniref:Dynein heavy chain 1, axonemal-like n=1 Tax=Priapulus caudatus TaxID=37621 RepID=A0ABM1EPK9_PRICU|nr:PREDICTED: dynein heavy chain 1, axonemal-like [Priapulus caudatus]